MESVLTSFFSVSTIVFCIVLSFIVLIIRRLVEAAAKKVAKYFPDKWEPWWVEFWREWVLPVLPIVLGVLIAFFVPLYPFPELFAATSAGRIFFGAVCGGASGYVYRFFKFYLKKLLPNNIKEKAEQIESQLEGPDETE